MDQEQTYTIMHIKDKTVYEAVDAFEQGKTPEVCFPRDFVWAGTVRARCFAEAVRIAKGEKWWQHPKSEAQPFTRSLSDLDTIYCTNGTLRMDKDLLRVTRFGM
jgi:hypothetical protein